MSRGVKLVGGIGLSLVLLVWAVHDVQLARVISHARNANIGEFLGAVALATLTLPLRAWRWRYTLQQPSAPFAFRDLFRAASIGTMVNNLLPARVGELARAYALRQLAGAPFSAALASIVVERVFDGVVILGLMAVALGSLPVSSGGGTAAVSIMTVAWGSGALFVLALLIVVLLATRPEAFIRWGQRAATRLGSEAWGERVARVGEAVALGLGALRSGHRLGNVVVWSVVIWVVNALAITVGLRAFDIRLPWMAAAVVQALISLGIALPSSPGFFGPFEAACRAALVMYGLPGDLALGFALPFHILGYFVPVTVIGLWSLARSGLRWRDVGHPSMSEPAGDSGHAARMQAE